MMRTGAGLRRIVSSAKSHCGCGFSALDPEASLHPFVKSGEKAAWRGLTGSLDPVPHEPLHSTQTVRSAPVFYLHYFCFAWTFETKGLPWRK
jgi:hypothetical protein